MKRLLLVAALTALTLGACGPKDKGANNALPPVESWCPEGFEAGPNDTCFVLPPGDGKKASVLVYLHGMFDGQGAPEEWAAAKSATEKGFAVVIPRGRRGLCAWKAELAHHFCWPGDAEDTQLTQELVSKWEKVLWQVDTLLEGGSHKRYVLGYGSGGVFATTLATTGAFPASGYAVVNGGGPAHVAKAQKPAPLVLIAADKDAEEGPKMRTLHESLDKAGWAHGRCPKGGGSTLGKDDVETALKFFTKGAGCEGDAPPPPPPPKK
ncbi:MAG: hypothetical protein JNL38_11820 [Myxococcales bacterium]|jgi:poly(3-hydroxybutyrate) depolymerase|nr:hypothetical protein [Myxococcales bacterium]